MNYILKTKKIVIISISLFIFLGIVSASDLFTTIKNPWGPGFFIINTARGQVSIINFLDKNHGIQNLIGIVDTRNNLSGKYLPCINENYKNAFLLNTENGEVYTFNTNKNSLVKVVSKKIFDKKPIGTFIPILNKDGSGIFILNRLTGECYWTNDGIDLEPFLLNNNDK